MIISPHALVVGKTAMKGAVLLVAVEVVAYEISPATFSAVAVGLGALIVAIVAIATMVLTNNNNRKNREQVAQIAENQAKAAEESSKIASHVQTIEVRMDGRMDQLLEKTGAIAEAIGVKKGLQQAADEAVATAKKIETRDEKVVAAVAGAVVERIGDAADKAAQTVPASKP